MRYLDTSVLVPLFVPEPESDRIQSWVERQTGNAAGRKLDIKTERPI
jgi:predicted nucleic acid-binding protein